MSGSRRRLSKKRNQSPAAGAGVRRIARGPSQQRSVLYAAAAPWRPVAAAMVASDEPGGPSEAARDQIADWPPRRHEESGHRAHATLRGGPRPHHRPHVRGEKPESAKRVGDEDDAARPSPMSPAIRAFL